jgi:hypothetical protein
MALEAPFSFMGAAKLAIDIFDDNMLPTGLALKGNCTKLSIKPDSELVEEYGASDTDLYQTIASAVIPKPLTSDAEFNQLDSDLFALAFMGTKSVFSQTGGSVSAPGSDLVTIPDRYVEIGKNKISGVVVKNSAGTVTYTLGTDYLLDARLGAIMALSSGTITAAATVKVAYTFPTITGSMMKGMTKSNIRARLLLHGKNFADNREFILEIYRARFAPSADFNFQNAIDKKFLRIAFKMTLETPFGMDHPFKLTWLS